MIRHKEGHNNESESNISRRFLVGAAMSGPQMEGTFEKPHENVMDYWYKTSKEEFLME